MGRLSLRLFIRRQDIVYRVPGTAWDEALPLGDGCFGAVAYQYQEGNAFLPNLRHKMAVHEAPVPYLTPRTAYGVPRESSVPGCRAEGGHMANPR